MAEQKTTPITHDTGTVTAIIGTTGLAVNLGDRPVAVVVPSSLVGAAMVGSRALLAVDGDVYTLADVITGAWIGATQLYFGATPPAGWLICNGAAFSADTYPFLNTHLGSTTLPDARDRSPVGASGTKAAKSTGGADAVTLTAAELPAHTHDITNIGLGAFPAGSGSTGYYPSGASSATTSAGSGNSFSIQNKYLAMHLIIKAA